MLGKRKFIDTDYGTQEMKKSQKHGEEVEITQEKAEEIKKRFFGSLKTRRQG